MQTPFPLCFVLSVMLTQIPLSAESLDDRDLSGWESLAGENDFIDYTVTQDVAEEGVRKLVTTYVTIYPAPWGCSFAQTEEVLGSLAPISITNARYHGVITETKVEFWIHDLRDLGIAVPSLPQESRVGSSAMLCGKTGTDRFQYSYALPALSNRTTTIHNRLLAIGSAFTTNLKGDRSTSVTEGDEDPPSPVSMNALLLTPEAYNGKRISTSGYYRSRHFEESYLFVDSNAADLGEDGIWLGKPSCFANPNEWPEIQDGWLTVTGVFNSNTDEPRMFDGPSISRLTKKTRGGGVIKPRHSSIQISPAAEAWKANDSGAD